MCGICGLIDSKGGFVSPERIRSMSDKMVHRGPDDSGSYLDTGSLPHVGLGHRRLSIIDLSSKGRQPMSNEDGTVWLVLNGEIYNYRELRESLKEKGHIFRSDTDTEVLIHLYEEHGQGCAGFLRGMFAFAVWDKNTGTLTAARDRAGKKPFLYFDQNGLFCFASEFASLLSCGLVDKDVNLESIDDYLSFGYIPAPATIYNNIRKLMPGHILVHKQGRTVVSPYWKPDYSAKIRIGEKEAASETLRMLEDAVSIRLRSDVPLGAFLSGGIDSSAVVALMARSLGKKVRTFSIGFNEKFYDELRYARIVAKRIGTDHNEFIVKPDALDILPLLVERYGEPYADSSCLPTFYVCRETRRHVTVALNGDGGDELFAGYERYQAMRLADIYGTFPSPMRAALTRASDFIPDSISSKNRAMRIKRFVRVAGLSRKTRYFRWISIIDENLKHNLYSKELREIFAGRRASALLDPYLDKEMAADPLDRVLEADLHTYLPNDLLVKVDIASMANSLEARSPFLDHKLIEFAAALPAEYKMKHLVKKYILKKALKGIVPRENIGRKKMGFGMPVSAWFRGPLKGFLIDTVFSDKAGTKRYFNKDVLDDILKRHLRGRNDYGPHLWALMMLELWHKRFIDG